MEPPSTSNGPRPLATKPDYIRRLYTSKAGLLTPSLSSSSSTPAPSHSSDTPELDLFDFKRHMDDSLLQPNAKRARKIYRSILRDQHFLVNLKQMWEHKLKQLQVEHAMLSQMSNYTQEDVNDAPPLFSEAHIDLYSQHQLQQQTARIQRQQQDSPSEHRCESLPVLQNGWASHVDSSALDEEHTTSPDTLDMTSRKRAREESDTPRDLPEPVRFGNHPRADNDDVHNDSDVGYFSGIEGDEAYDTVEEEDEETARKALTFMLANYGTDL